MRGSEKPTRAFLAFSLPDEVAARLGEIQKGMAGQGARIRWVKPCNMHLTIRFLSDVMPQRLAAVIAAVKKAAEKEYPFLITVKGLGVFPSIRKPRVLWAGVTGETERLSALAGRIEDALSPLGFTPEKRGFKAHLTLGRIKSVSDIDRFVGILRENSGFNPLNFKSDTLFLFKSELKPDGPVYSIIKAFKLG